MARKLNRELVAHLVPRKIEEVGKEILDYAQRKIATQELPEHEIYGQIGRWLVDFNGIGQCELMSELQEKFVRLGRDVAYLTQALGDNGVSEEEFAWLGKFSLSFRNAGGETFEFAPSVAKLEPIQDCSPQERTLLYVYYLKGLKYGFIAEEKFPYGAAFSKTKQVMQV